MSDLVDVMFDAHGGLDRFRQFAFLNARLHQGGVLWGLKGQPTVLQEANVRVDLNREWVSHWPFAPPTDYRSQFTPPKRVTIETPAGEVVEQLDEPRDSFAGYVMETPPWSNAQVAYFAGYTMWTYLTSPFILARPGVSTEEIEPWTENGETWRRLRVTFPPGHRHPQHSPDLLRRRNGGAAASPRLRRGYPRQQSRSSLPARTCHRAGNRAALQIAHLPAQRRQHRGR